MSKFANLSVDSIINEPKSAVMTAGIQPNVTLNTVEYKTFENSGSKGLVFEFSSPAGQFRHIEWLPNENKVYPRTDKEGNTETKEEAYVRTVNDCVRRIGHIMARFVSAEEITKVINKLKKDENVESALKNFSAVLNKADLSTVVELKLHYNNKGYTRFPSTPRFIRTENEPQLPVTAYDTKKFMRPESDSSASVSADVVAAVTMSEDDDLPF